MNSLTININNEKKFDNKHQRKERRVETEGGGYGGMFSL